MITQEEISAKFGVPLPETCKELNWENKTFYFYKDGCLCSQLRYSPLVNFWLATPIDSDGITYFKARYKEDFIPAPQMHEIAPMLPEKIDGYQSNGQNIWYQLLSKSMSKQLVYGYKNDFDDKLCVNIIDWNYAEAYAQLYLKLKILCNNSYKIS